MKVLTEFSILTLIFLVTSFAPVYATDGNEKISKISWEVDHHHSAINFTVNHFFTPVGGIFEEFEAELLFNPENLAASSIDVAIPASSVNTRHQDRDDHLRSEDFFNVAEWPTMRFVSNTIEKTGDNKFVAKGKLTIRDVTRDFELPFEFLGVMDHPFMENSKVAGIVANTKLQRSDFNVGVGSWAATAVVGNTVDIRINLELTTPK